MAEETTSMTKQEARPAEATERLRGRKVYTPKVDILETESAILVAADMPGVDQDSVEVTLEKGVLTIDGRVEWQEPKSHDLVYREYGVGDYHRAFSLSDAIDQDKIEARVKDGVLRLTLPKAGPARARQIEVKGG